MQNVGSTAQVHPDVWCNVAAKRRMEDRSIFAIVTIVAVHEKLVLTTMNNQEKLHVNKVVDHVRNKNKKKNKQTKKPPKNRRNKTENVAFSREDQA